MAKAAATALILILALLGFHIVQSQDGIDHIPSTLAWSPNGRLMAIGYIDGTIEIWDITDRTIIHVLQGHREGVTTLVWSPDGLNLASGSTDGRALIWDIATGRQNFDVSLASANEPDRPVMDIDWSSDSRYFVGIKANGGLWVSDAHTGEIIAGNPQSPMLITVAWQPFGNNIASGGTDGNIVIWDLETQLSSNYSFPSDQITGAVGAITLSPSGDKMAVSRGGLGQPAYLQIFDFSTGEILHEVPLALERAGLISLAWSPIDERLAAIDQETILIIDTTTGSTLATLDVGILHFSVSWSPFAGQLAVSLADNSITTDTEIPYQIVVPDPSPERLQSIAESCNAPPPIQQAAANADTSSEIAAFVTAVEALPIETIPPACAADLLAIADAMHDQ